MTVDPAAWLDRPGVRRLLLALDAEHGHARFVGGAVRDLLSGEHPVDLDLATTHQPEEVVARLQAAGIKAIPTGIAHGTVTAVSSGTVVEVTTLRADLTTDGRRATVAFTDDWKADAARRDFTINALYADPLTGELFDYWGGLDDLSARRVRFIGEPLQRIAEDHLRILRYFRFHARYGSGSPDPATLAACVARANDLMALSRERIADELLKLLSLPDPEPTVRLMHQSGLFEPVLPEISTVERLAHLIAAENEAGIARDPLRRLAAVLPADPDLADRVAARLKLSNKARKRLSLAADHLEKLAPRPMAYRVGTEAAVDRLLLTDQPSEAAQIVGWTPPRLPISGGQLIARGVAQGPDVARTLRRIEDAWEDADFPDGAAFEAIVTAALPDA
ncbi:CCA tRNA nucleotidyltransferase [Sphingomonas sp. LY160]|uniref:CCA tRNA nucleotidyltransferase n=1 Tax=Sphingomonas sp. LY160 TaxID=3095342 RepID=UPI002ADEC60C|nr:CCA tRNA nucleotidyltransferase [Sphingomonas sp. LY160]MEA1073027.1 CCA tRNA nucleotidyltransferase [Sphingomonas sp. LY160]